MRTKLPLLCAAIAMAGSAMVFAEFPKNHEPPAGSFLDPNLSFWVKSPREIEAKIKESLRFKYSEDTIADGYKIYQATNGAAKWIFVVAANGPRGTDWMNLYCYEQMRPDRWLLRGYIPLTGAYFPKTPDWGLRLKSQGDHINVFFRDTVVYTTPTEN